MRIRAAVHPEVPFALLMPRTSVTLMHRLSITGMALALVACGVLAFLIFNGPQVHMAQCDGTAPRWMLEATNYEGGGCAEVLPSEAAPGNADWTPYCLGYCICKLGGNNFRGVACEALPFVIETPEPPSFDLSAVQATYTAGCGPPRTAVGLVCQQLRIHRMSAEGDTLTVRTRLSAEDRDRAAAICDQLAIAHFDREGRDLGYQFIEILTRASRTVATCQLSDQ